MSDPMMWDTWPPVAGLNNDSVTGIGAGAEDLLSCETLTGNGDEGLKRRAACDECRTRTAPGRLDWPS